MNYAVPALEETPQALVDGLFTSDQLSKLAAIRKIKNSIIGSRSKKSTFMLLGVIPRLVSFIGNTESDAELVCEAVITLGSFAHGTPENVQAVLSANALPLLLRGLSHSNTAVLHACARTLRTLVLCTGRVSSIPIFEDITAVRHLVHLVSSCSSVSQSAAAVLAKACQDQNHQNLLCACGIIGAVSQCLKASVPKLHLVSLQCLSSVVYGNRMTAAMVTEDCCGQPVVSAVLALISGSKNIVVKLAAAECLVHLCGAGAISPDSSVINLKVLPILVQLCKTDYSSEIRAQAAKILAYLTLEDEGLQELAANSDKLIATLVDCLENRPNETDDLVQERHFDLYDTLRESCFLALASLSSQREETRMKVISEKNMRTSLSAALEGESMNVKIAAAKCLHSLCRSTKLLRTAIVDAEVWKPILSMLSLRDEECLLVASGVACNLMLSFSPSRESMINGGAVEVLCSLLLHECAAIQKNALWALMSVSCDATLSLKAHIRNLLTMEGLLRLLNPAVDEGILMKALGLIINLLAEEEDADAVMSEYGCDLLSCIVKLLLSNPSNEVTEQVVLVVGNAAHGSAKTKDAIINCDSLLSALSHMLHFKDCPFSVLAATCCAVASLADSKFPDHIHRHNVLSDYGIKVAIQKLERVDNFTVQEVARSALEQFLV